MTETAPTTTSELQDMVAEIRRLVQKIEEKNGQIKKNANNRGLKETFLNQKKNLQNEKGQKISDFKKHYSKADYQFWMINGMNEKGTLYTEVKGLELADEELTSNQIRNFFGEVKKLQSMYSNNSTKAKNKVALLKPKLAYAYGKEKKDGLKLLKALLDPALDAVGTSATPAESFDNFVDYFEALLAYHRYYGGGN